MIKIYFIFKYNYFPNKLIKNMFQFSYNFVNYIFYQIYNHYLRLLLWNNYLHLKIEIQLQL